MVTVSPLPILRLIERMVRSGARTHWLRAVRPTSTSPVGDTPTTDGSRRSPATGHICMVPFWMTPSTELVVPRSIPIILLVSLMTGLLWRSLARRLGGRRARHHDFGVAQHALLLTIALTEHADDRIRRHIVSGLGLESDVQTGIEGSIEGLNRVNTLGSQYGQETITHQCQPLQPGVHDVRHARHGVWEGRPFWWGGRHRDSLAGKRPAQLLPDTRRRRQQHLLRGGTGRRRLPRGNLLALLSQQRLPAGQRQLHTVQRRQQLGGECPPCLPAHLLELYLTPVLPLDLELFPLGDQVLEGEQRALQLLFFRLPQSVRLELSAPESGDRARQFRQLFLASQFRQLAGQQVHL